MHFLNYNMDVHENDVSNGKIDSVAFKMLMIVFL